MKSKQEKLILETLFIILESVTIKNLPLWNPIDYVNQQKLKINDRLVEIQKEEKE